MFGQVCCLLGHLSWPQASNPGFDPRWSLLVNHALLLSSHQVRPFSPSFVPMCNQAIQNLIPPPEHCAWCSKQEDEQWNWQGHGKLVVWSQVLMKASSHMCPFEMGAKKLKSGLTKIWLICSGFCIDGEVISWIRWVAIGRRNSGHSKSLEQQAGSGDGRDIWRCHRWVEGSNQGNTRCLIWCSAKAW